MPAPKTATEEPASTSAFQSAAAMPVVAPQASRQIASKLASGSTLASAISGMTVYSAKVLVPMKWRSSPFSREKRVVPSGSRPSPCIARIAVQMLVLPLRQLTHSPHSGENRQTTWSPFFRLVTPSPTSSTMPAPSWPSTQSQ